MRKLLFYALLFWPCLGWTFDIYTLVGPKCQTVRGVFIYVDSEYIQFLSEDGREHIIPRSKVNFVIIHNTFENPIRKVTMTPTVRERLKRVFVSSNKTPTFEGWPVKFIDNLVIFFDTTGKYHVLELEKIQRIRDFKNTSIKSFDLKSAPSVLSYGDSIGSCTKQLQSRKNGIIPTRILGDKIQISEFLNNFEEGYDQVYSFQERTYLYAKPFLFDEETKLGFTLYQKAFENPALEDVPAYFQWSAGRPYRFQSFNQIGYVNVPYLPTIEPLLVARSEVKSHFFRGSFVGNLAALPAGTEYYTKFKTEDNQVFGPTVTRAGVGINYMAFIGADYENWSVGLGSAYNTYYIQAKTYFREILGSSVSPVLRIMYTAKDWSAYGIAGMTDIDSNNPTDLQISRSDTQSVVNIIQSFKFRSNFIRGGLEYTWGKSTRLGGNVLYLDAKFNETEVTTGSNFFNWNSKNFHFYFHKQFGEYVSLQIFGNSMNFDYRSTINSISGASANNEFVYGGNFEFVF